MFESIYSCIIFLFFEESLVCLTCVDKTGRTWEEEYDDIVLSLLEDKQPSYLIYQLNSKSEWLLITYSPDDSPVRKCYYFNLKNVKNKLVAFINVIFMDA